MGGKAAAGWRLKGAFSARCGAARSAEGYDARGGGAAAGRVEAGGGGGGWAAAIRGGGGGEAGSYRVLVSQKWEANEAKMPPGSAAPLGRRAEEGRPALSPPPYPPPPSPSPFRGSPAARPLPRAGFRRPRVPSEPVRGLGALRRWRLRVSGGVRRWWSFSSPRHVGRGVVPWVWGGKRPRQNHQKGAFPPSFGGACPGSSAWGRRHGGGG